MLGPNAANCGKKSLRITRNNSVVKYFKGSRTRVLRKVGLILTTCGLGSWAAKPRLPGKMFRTPRRLPNRQEGNLGVVLGGMLTPPLTAVNEDREESPT